jgi:hypothetical protein
MTVKMDAPISSWVKSIRDNVRLIDEPATRGKKLTRAILGEMERLGSARRRLRSDGTIVWEATESFLEFLKDREFDAPDDLDDED